MDLADARKKYTRHKANCTNKRDRNGDPVKMLLSFEDWCRIWEQSGHWHERGGRYGGANSYVMARNNDIGHYEVGNVTIKTTSENFREAHLGVKWSQERKDKAKSRRQSDNQTERQQ